LRKIFGTVKNAASSAATAMKLPEAWNALAGLVRRALFSPPVVAMFRFVSMAARVAGRFAWFMATRMVFFGAFIQCTHIPSIVPTGWIITTRLPPAGISILLLLIPWFLVRRFRKSRLSAGRFAPWLVYFLIAFFTVIIEILFWKSSSKGLNVQELMLAFIIYRSAVDARWSPPGRLSQAAFLLLGAYTLVLWYPMFYIVHAVFPWLLPLIAVAGGYRVYRLRHSGLSLYRRSVKYVLAPACCLFVATVLVFSYARDCGDGSRQPGLEYYVNYCSEGDEIIPRYEIENALAADELHAIMKDFRFVFQYGSKVFVSATEGASFMFDTEEEKVYPVRPSSGFFSLYLDPETGNAITAHTKDSALRVYDPGSMELVMDIDLSAVGSPYWLDAHAGLRRLFVGFSEREGHTLAQVYGLDGMKLLRSEPLRNGAGGMVEANLARGEDRVFFVTLFDTEDGNYIGSYDMRTMELVRTRNLPWFCAAVVHVPERGSIFVVYLINSPGHGGIEEWDAETFETIDSMDVPIAGRDLVYADDGFLYLSNYIFGNIYRIDWDRKEITGRADVGRKIKRMEYSPEFNALFFTSERGYARLDLDDWPE